MYLLLSFLLMPAHQCTQSHLRVQLAALCYNRDFTSQGLPLVFDVAAAVCVCDILRPIYARLLTTTCELMLSLPTDCVHAMPDRCHHAHISIKRISN